MTFYQEKVKKFLVSSFWNFGIFIVLDAINVFSQNMGGFNLSPTELALASIFLSRCTKILNVMYQEHQATLE